MSRGSSSTTSPRTARRPLLRLRRAYGCLGTSGGSSLTSSPTPHVRVPQHVTWHVARLVVDYFTYTTRPSASARRAARRRLLRLRHAYGCLGTSRGSSLNSSPTPRVRVPQNVARLVVNYFAHATRPGDSERRATRRRLLCPRCAFGCLGTSRGSSLTSSPTPRIRVPQHVVWQITRLFVDYFAYAARLSASAHRAARRRLLHPRCARPGDSARHAARHRLLLPHRASGCLSTSRGSSRGSSSTTSPRKVC
jgi:hypothetical protein